MIVIVQINAPAWMGQGIKEDLAMHLEKFGDARVLEVREDNPQQAPRQMKIGGNR